MGAEGGGKGATKAGGGERSGLAGLGGSSSFDLGEEKGQPAWGGVGGNSQPDWLPRRPSPKCRVQHGSSPSVLPSPRTAHVFTDAFSVLPGALFIRVVQVTGDIGRPNPARTYSTGYAFVGRTIHCAHAATPTRRHETQPYYCVLCICRGHSLFIYLYIAYQAQRPGRC